VSISLPQRSSLVNSTEEARDESEVVEGEWRGVSIGEVTAVEGEESLVTVLRRSSRCGRAVVTDGAISVDLWQ